MKKWKKVFGPTSYVADFLGVAQENLQQVMKEEKTPSTEQVIRTATYMAELEAKKFIKGRDGYTKTHYSGIPILSTLVGYQCWYYEEDKPPE